MPGEVLEIDNLELSFGAVKALTGVSFRIEAGTVHSVIGPNGAGKSSLLNVISGLYRPQKGSVRWGTTELTGLRPDQITQAGIGRSFQNIGLAAQQSVSDNIMFGRHRLMRSGMLADGLGLPRSRREEYAHRTRVEEIADFLGLSPWLSTQVSELSYGHQKRVDLARAIAMEPRVLLLDEPAAGSNSAEKREIAQLVRSLVPSLGLTVVLVEHDMEMVMGLSDRITVLDFGRVIAEGSPGEVREDPRVVGAYLGTVEEAAL
jgi:branched-chain amino acid transport system ATP-binding protein